MTLEAVAHALAESGTLGQGAIAAVLLLELRKIERALVQVAAETPEVDETAIREELRLLGRSFRYQRDEDPEDSSPDAD